MHTFNFHEARVLVLGDVMLDSYYFGITERISPEAPVPVVKVNAKEERPGGAANVALNAAALGASVRILSVVGQDEAANTLVKELHCRDVLTDFIQWPQMKTIVKQRILSQHQQLLRLDFEASFPGGFEEELLEKFKSHLAWANVVILSDYAKGVLRPSARVFIEAARANNIPVLVDPKHADFHFYEGATLITPNLKEFKAVIGDLAHDENELVEKAKSLIQDCDLEALLVTRGDEGMTLIERDAAPYNLPASGREVFDVTGAGDTVIATIAIALATKFSLREAVALGNTAAGVVIGKLGTATLTTQELERAISGHTALQSAIVDEATLLLRVEEARARGEKIVFTNGCFDVLHAMHVEYLNLASLQGHRLIVAVNDDASITRLKGQGRPVNKAEHRMAVLAGLQSVDWVLQMHDDTPNRLLDLIRPDVLVKGGDYGMEGVVGADVVEAYGGKVMVLGGVVPGVKSTAIIERIQKLASSEKT